MKKRLVRILSSITVSALVCAMVLQAQATTISGLQNQIAENQGQLSEVNDVLSDLEDEQDLLEEEISDLDAELLNTLTEIGILEDEITEKEELIEKAQAAYDEAKAEEEAQYAAMERRIQQVYEMGDADYLTTLFQAVSFADMLNDAGYIEAVYSYDQRMLESYIATKEHVRQLWDELEAEKLSLETERADLENTRIYLDELLEQKRAESANYEAQIARARQEANALKVKIQQEQKELKKLQDEEKRRLEEERRRQAAAAAANGSYSVSASVSDIINNAGGSELGKQIARYGCQFIGNPYVAGGTSLTNGADCSGFTYRIYSDFGYSIPRTSYSQRSAGREVAYSDAQPGDLICYEGHVALYIGGGYIVHASSAKTGIKVSKATYRTILSVRRII